MTTATAVWRALLRDVLERGRPVEQDSPGANFRGRTSYEIIGNQTVWPMANPVAVCPNRKIGFRFLAAEAAFILSGSNRLEEIAPYAKHMVEFSDDGEFLAGAYGPPFRDQTPYIVQTLARDRFSRQAVQTCGRPRPGPSRDTPCTISLQHLIRDEAGVLTLHTVATMRSNDVIFGTPYDVHAFSMLSAYVALYLRDRLGPLALGDLHLTAGSQHLYHLDRATAEGCVWETQSVVEKDDVRVLRTDEAIALKPLDLARFDRPQELVDHLWAIARKDSQSAIADGWLTETLI